MKAHKFAVSVALAVTVALPASAATTGGAALWGSDFSPGLSESACWPYQLNPQGFCYSDESRNGLELGLKFQATRTALITGLRIYRVDPGDVRGSLWLDDGTLLVRGRFSAQAGHGWQDMTFDQPVVIVPGKTYIASYFTPGTHYAFQYEYFASELAAGPIVAPAGHAGAPNGVHCYDDDACGQFPSKEYRSSSYWVTPIWRELSELSESEIEALGEAVVSGGVAGGNAVAYDTVAPVVKRVVRAKSNTIKVTFSESIKGSTVTGRSVRLLNGRRVRTNLRLSGQHLVIDPRRQLSRGPYRVLITEAVQDKAGNALAKPARRSFRVR